MSEKMTTSEPTTEIVEEITSQSTTRDIVVVLKMIVQYLESFTMDKMSRDVMSAAADRLESQEQTIAELMVTCETMHQEMQAMIDCHKPNLDKIAALTARAEQAEAREKAENRIKLLEGAIERQNNTITYLNSTNGQGFNW